MGRYSDYYEARAQILKIVSEDLLGPVTEDEVINEPPASYYVMGKLYPRTEKDLEQDDNTTSADLDALDADASLATANIRNPRAMGITYTVNSGAEELHVVIKYAFYKPFGLSAALEKGVSVDRYKTLIDQADDKEKERMVFWQRDFMCREVTVPTLDSSGIEIERGIFLRTYLHFSTESGERIFTTVLTNERYVPDNDRNAIAANTVMQPEIIIEGPAGQETFTEVRRQVAMSNNEELLQLDMLYDADKCYAQGHGCAVMWDTEHKTPEFIRTVFYCISICYFFNGGI